MKFSNEIMILKVTLTP